MGLLDFAANVVTRYKADVSDHVKELSKLKGEAAKAAAAQLEQHKKLNESLQSQLTTLQRVREGIGSVTAVVQTARAAIHSYAEHSRLAARTSGGVLDALTKATRGLKNEHDLLTTAAGLSRAEFALSSTQMAVATQAMISFERAGINAKEAQDIVTNALVKLETDGLKKAGIAIDKTGLSMDKQADRAKILERVLAALSVESDKFARSQLTAGENALVAANKLENATDRLQRNVGKGLAATISTVEYSAQQLAKFLGGPKGDDTLANWINREFIEAGERLKYLSHAYGTGDPTKIANALQGDRIASGQAPSARLDEIQYGRGYTVTRDEKQTKSKPAVDPAVVAAARARAEKLREQANEYAKQYTDELVERLTKDLDSLTPGERSNVFDRSEFAIPSANKQFDSDVDKALKSFYGGSEWSKRVEDTTNARNESRLAKVFGPIEDFDLYAKSFQMLEGAVGSSLGAWIDGSMSAGKAFKAFIAESVKGLAVEMAIQALKHGAYAIGSLATGNFAGAALHGKAAAAFGLGAVAASVAAKSLNGSASTPSVGGRAPSGAGAGSAGGVATGNTYVVVYGDPTEPYMNQHNAKKLIKKVMGGAGVQQN